jgi:hypothetical protein
MVLHQVPEKEKNPQDKEGSNPPEQRTRRAANEKLLWQKIPSQNVIVVWALKHTGREKLPYREMLNVIRDRVAFRSGTFRVAFLDLKQFVEQLFVGVPGAGLPPVQIPMVHFDMSL